jgi:hypothetical protein
MVAPLLHIGFHKTGTTWLQRHFFNCRSAGFCAPIHTDDVIRELVLPNALDFDAQACRARLDPTLAAGRARELVPVVSAERLSGNPHSGGYDTGGIAERLRNVFPDARVLIVIREQAAIIRSCYKQYVKVGGTLPLDAYLNPPKDSKIPHFDFQHFAYDRIIRCYYRLFGRDHVLVLAYEQFKSSAVEFLRSITVFSGAHAEKIALPLCKIENRSLADASLSARRWLNRVATVPSSLNQQSVFHTESIARVLAGASNALAWSLPAGIHERATRKLQAQVAAATLGRYGSTNRAVIELTALPLAELGYTLE